MKDGKPKVVVYAVVFLLVGIAVGGLIGYYVPHPSTKPPESISVFAAGSLAYALGDHFNPYFKNTTGITAGSTFPVP